MIKRIRVVAGVAVDKDGNVLMGLRPPDKQCPSMWEYPGGKVELAEGDETALKREWREELHVVLRVGRRIARVTFDLDVPVVISLYHVHADDQTPMVSDSIREIRWVAPAHAVRCLPCTPSTYLTYAAVKTFLARLQ